MIAVVDNDEKKVARGTREVVLPFYEFSRRAKNQEKAEEQSLANAIERYLRATQGRGPCLANKKHHFGLLRLPRAKGGRKRKKRKRGGWTPTCHGTAPLIPRVEREGRAWRSPRALSSWVGDTHDATRTSGVR